MLEKIGINLSDDQIYKMISDIDPGNTVTILYSEFKIRIVETEAVEGEGIGEAMHLLGDGLGLWVGLIVLHGGGFGLSLIVIEFNQNAAFKASALHQILSISNLEIGITVSFERKMLFVITVQKAGNQVG